MSKPNHEAMADAVVMILILVNTLLIKYGFISSSAFYLPMLVTLPLLAIAIRSSREV